MADTTITCSKCGAPIELTTAMTASIEQRLRAKYDAEAAQKQEALAALERTVKAEKAQLERAKLDVDAVVAERVATEKTAIVAQVKAMAKQEATTEIKLLQDQITEQTRRLATAAEKEAALQKRERDLEDAKRGVEAQLKAGEAAVARAKADVDALVADRVKTERTVIASEEARKAKLAAEADLSGKDRLIGELTETVKQLNMKLTTAQQSEAESRRKQRELDDKLREADLTIEKKVGEQVSAVRTKAREEADDAARLRLMEREKVISDLQKQMDEMKRTAEKTSQQLQGEVQEMDLKATLEAQFPRDVVEDVVTGKEGADLLHKVIGSTGRPCGTILWESKRTKNWSDAWLAKLRKNQREEKAEIAVVVTQAMPDGVTTCQDIDGVWVTTFALAGAVACLLRAGLIETAAARGAAEGQQTKAELLYGYVTGLHFRQRVQAMLEGYSALKDELEGEKRAMKTRWAAREKQLDIVLQATAGMFGDLQGIAGKTLQEIEGLELKALGVAAANGEK